MRLYEGTITEFNTAVLGNEIADRIGSSYEKYYKKRVNPSEFRAWQQSLNFLNNSFQYTGLVDNRIIIEYELPYSTRRIDVLVFGRDLHKGDSVVLIELKQWSNDNVEDCPSEGNIVVDYGRFKKRTGSPLPSKFRGYHYDLKDFSNNFSTSSPRLH